MILGGCGTTLEELTGLFSAFANEGIYITPFLYAERYHSSSSNNVISPAANYMINEILSKVNRPDFPLNWTATERMPKIAWKTGTSYGRRDAWSIGYNKNYTVGIWAGNFSGVGVADLSGANIARLYYLKFSIQLIMTVMKNGSPNPRIVISGRYAVKRA